MPWRPVDFQVSKTITTFKPRMFNDYSHGIVELGAIVFPMARATRFEVNPKAFVDGRYRQPWNGNKRSMQIVSNEKGLQWPDPLLDWLKRGMFAIGPDLLSGNIPGAVASGVKWLGDDIIDWCNKKWNSSGGGEPPDNFFRD